MLKQVQHDGKQQKVVEILKPIYETPYKNITGRRLAVMAAVQND